MMLTSLLATHFVRSVQPHCARQNAQRNLQAVLVAWVAAVAVTGGASITTQHASLVLVCRGCSLPCPFPRGAQATIHSFKQCSAALVGYSSTRTCT